MRWSMFISIQYHYLKFSGWFVLQSDNDGTTNENKWINHWQFPEIGVYEPANNGDLLLDWPHEQLMSASPGLMSPNSWLGVDPPKGWQITAEIYGSPICKMVICESLDNSREGRGNTHELYQHVMIEWGDIVLAISEVLLFSKYPPVN